MQCRRFPALYNIGIHLSFYMHEYGWTHTPTGKAAQRKSTGRSRTLKVIRPDECQFCTRNNDVMFGRRATEIPTTGNCRDVTRPTLKWGSVYTAEGVDACVALRIVYNRQPFSLSHAPSLPPGGSGTVRKPRKTTGKLFGFDGRRNGQLTDIDMIVTKRKKLSKSAAWHNRVNMCHALESPCKYSPPLYRRRFSPRPSGPSLIVSIHSFIHFISQNTSYIKQQNVLKVFHRTERPVALTTAHTDTNTKQKTQSKWVIQIMSTVNLPVVLIIN